MSLLSVIRAKSKYASTCKLKRYDNDDSGSDDIDYSTVRLINRCRRRRRNQPTYSRSTTHFSSFYYSSDDDDISYDDEDEEDENDILETEYQQRQLKALNSLYYRIFASPLSPILLNDLTSRESGDETIRSSSSELSSSLRLYCRFCNNRTVWFATEHERMVHSVRCVCNVDSPLQGIVPSSSLRPSLPSTSSLSDDTDDEGNWSKGEISHRLTEDLWLGNIDENDNEDSDGTEDDGNEEGTTSTTQTDHNNPFSSMLTSPPRQSKMVVSPLSPMTTSVSSCHQPDDLLQQQRTVKPLSLSRQTTADTTKTAQSHQHQKQKRTKRRKIRSILSLLNLCSLTSCKPAVSSSSSRKSRKRRRRRGKTQDIFSDTSSTVRSTPPPASKGNDDHDLGGTEVTCIHTTPITKNAMSRMMLLEDEREGTVLSARSIASFTSDVTASTAMSSTYHFDNNNGNTVGGGTMIRTVTSSGALTNDTDATVSTSVEEEEQRQKGINVSPSSSSDSCAVGCGFVDDEYHHDVDDDSPDLLNDNVDNDGGSEEIINDEVAFALAEQLLLIDKCNSQRGKCNVMSILPSTQPLSPPAEVFGKTMELFSKEKVDVDKELETRFISAEETDTELYNKIIEQ